MPTEIPLAGAGRAKGKAEGQDKPREPVLWEGLQSCHVICRVGAEGRDCHYKMEIGGPSSHRQHLQGQCERGKLL